jgi:peptide methionine sulfoxide reductase msrA/msrB
MYSKSGYDITPLPRARVLELAASLTPEQRRILLNAGTEPPFCGDLLDNPKHGTYCCRLCSLPLFNSRHKFDSGTGWPSFDRSIDPDHVRYKTDRAHGMVRTEILCARCDGHLGHVFDDGPTGTRRRYCLNSASMAFIEEDEPMPEASRPVQTATAYFAGGCFWGVEHFFEHNVPGVLEAISGYQNGHTDNPTYKQVCTGTTGHAESVKVVFDPARVSYRDLLEVFFWIHDPTQLNRQGPDVGTQYRSAVFAADEAQLEEARRYVKLLAENDPRFQSRPIVTQVEMAQRFWEAEDYHQDYSARNNKACYIPQWTGAEPPAILTKAGAR